MLLEDSILGDKSRRTPCKFERLSDIWIRRILRQLRHQQSVSLHCNMESRYAAAPRDSFEAVLEDSDTISLHQDRSERLEKPLPTPPRTRQRTSIRQRLVAIGLLLNTILLMSILVFVAKIYYAPAPTHQLSSISADSLQTLGELPGRPGNLELLAEVNGLVPTCMHYARHKTHVGLP